MPRVTKVSTPIAHLVGPGKIKVVNRQLAFSIGDDAPLRLDAPALRRILCYGDVGISDQAFQMLFEHDIEVAWLSPTGQRCRGRIVAVDTPHTSLRVLQHRILADPAQQREAACRFVQAKIQSQRTAAQHYFRHGCQEARSARIELDQLHDRCTTASLDELRGLEGRASVVWFGILAQVLNAPWTFTQRVRRPPTDPVNALLSLGYTFLATRTEARCAAFGLEVQVGALHAFRPGRPSLACDVMEPFRVPAVDRWVIGVCNGGRVEVEHFEPDAERGGLRLKSGPFRVILRSWEEHWTAGSLEDQLDGSLQSFVAWLRENAPTPMADADEADASE